MAALYELKVLTKPVYKFTSQKLIFQQRFKSFAQISQPPLLTHDDFCQGINLSITSIESLISSSSDCFASSKTLLGKLNDITETIDNDYRCMCKSEATFLNKICIGNSLFLLKLSKGIKSENTACSFKVNLEMKTNSQFCTIKI